MKNACFKILFTIGSIAFSLDPAFGQGVLTPPGSPAPTMKTLAQIEPRTPISSLPFVISNAGSYYLTTNLTGVSGTNGITIVSDNVTLDLQGFVLLGVSGALEGIHVATNRVYLNLALRNGTIRGWPTNGVNADSSKGSRFSDLNVNSNGGSGLNPGEDAIVQHCVATSNGFDGFGGLFDSQCVFEGCTAAENNDAGFSVFAHSVLVDCDANYNTYDGFFLDFQCSARNCSAEYNGASGIDIDYTACSATHCSCNDNNTGILAADHCLVRECNTTFNNADGITAGPGSLVQSCVTSFNSGNGITVADDCAISDCNSRTNTGTASIGIAAGSGCTIKSCVAAANTANGIIVTNACVVEANLCHGNGSGNAGNGGIRCYGSSNRIDANHLVGNNANGLYLDGSGNTVIHNTAKGNVGTQYSVGTGNDVGPIGSAATATSPWANLQ